MNGLCETCANRPGIVSYGGRRLCGICAQKRTAASALPFVGAALAAAGLIAGSALLAEKLQGRESESPLEGLGKRLGGGFARSDGTGPARQARSSDRT